MNIGTAIKTLRKQKGFSQKEICDACGISVNALSLIETNVTFPQKTTIKSICDALGIPVSYLLFFAISDEDVPEEKRLAFNSLNNAIKTVLLNDN
ncbi:MAG: XRE family transcriptional regulator [Sphingobacteriaceae bacterium]|nr:XRE family transcriptional regulator [Sphingobacteriaceae bacterium]